MTEVSLTSYTIDTGITAATNIFIGTICTLFITIRTYCSTIRAPLTADTGSYTFAACIAVGTPTTVTDTADAVTTIGTNVSRTILALLTTALTDGAAAIAAITALAYYCTVSTSLTVCTPPPISRSAVLTGSPTLAA